MTDTTVRAPAPPGLLYAMADQRRSQLDAREAQAAAFMRRQLEASEARLYRDLAAVTELIDSTPAELRSPSWLYRQARARELLAGVEQELEAYGGEAARQVAQAQSWAQQTGAIDAQQMGAQAAGLRAGDFLGTNMANLSTAVGFLADGSPVSDLFARYGREATANAKAVLTQAVVQGWGADKTAREFRRTVTGMMASRAELVARTELHRVYRATSRDTYHANADVLTGWVWLAKLDARTCASCIIMSGTMHPLDETLDGHPRCRCVMVPITGPWQAIDPRLAELRNTTAQVPTGADWLRQQPARTQKAVLGSTKYGLVSSGQVRLEDLVHRTTDPVWGTMRREATIAEARAAAAARGVRQSFPGKPKAAAASRRAVKRELPAAKAAAARPPVVPVEAPPVAPVVDPTKWYPVPLDAARSVFPDVKHSVWVRGPHAITSDIPLGSAEQGFLDDVADALDKTTSHISYESIRVHVPKPGADSTIGTGAKGWVGGYTSKGENHVVVNPDVARGIIPDYVAQAAQAGANGGGHFMPAASTVTVRQWTLAHELGHLADGSNNHVWEFTDVRGVEGVRNRAEELAFHRAHKGELSKYGQSLPGEGYAEAFAAYQLGERTPAVLAYAERYGWDQAKPLPGGTTRADIAKAKAEAPAPVSRAAPPVRAVERPAAPAGPIDLAAPRTVLQASLQTAPAGTRIPAANGRWWVKASNATSPASRWRLEGGDVHDWLTSSQLSYALKRRT